MANRLGAGVRREVGEGVKVSKKSKSARKYISVQVLQETERQLEGLKSRLLKGHGEEVQFVNGFRSGERINGQAAGGQMGWWWSRCVLGTYL